MKNLRQKKRLTGQIQDRTNFRQDKHKQTYQHYKQDKPYITDLYRTNFGQNEPSEKRNKVINILGKSCGSSESLFGTSRNGYRRGDN